LYQGKKTWQWARASWIESKRSGKVGRYLRQLIADLGLRRPVVLGHSAGGTVAALVALATDVGGVILLEAMIGNRAFTEDAAAQSAPLATSLGVPVVGFDAYLAE
jgi:pimeloyl-ACP methyl ester carboxylesterase